MTRLLFVTPCRHHARMGGWNPWRELRGRDHITLQLTPAAAHLGGGFYARRGGRAFVGIDPELDQAERKCALAHELIHDERGVPGPNSPEWVIAVEERTVDRITAQRLLPDGTLDRVVDEVLAEHDHVTAGLIAEAAEVDFQVAELRLGQLLDQRRSRHPSSGR